MAGLKNMMRRIVLLIVFTVIFFAVVLAICTHLLREYGYLVAGGVAILIYVLYLLAMCFVIEWIIHSRADENVSPHTEHTRLSVDRRVAHIVDASRIASATIS